MTRSAWPRTCAGCASESYKNPIPVVVVLLPVDGGVLVIRRGIPPHVGALALPGGYAGVGESWQEAGAREVYEETGITIPASSIRPVDVKSTPDGAMVLIFGVAEGVRAGDLPPFSPTDETTERLVVMEPTTLAFPLHTAVLSAHFEGLRAGVGGTGRPLA